MGTAPRNLPSAGIVSQLRSSSNFFSRLSQEWQRAAAHVLAGFDGTVTTHGWAHGQRVHAYIAFAYAYVYVHGMQILYMWTRAGRARAHRSGSGGIDRPFARPSHTSPPTVRRCCASSGDVATHIGQLSSLESPIRVTELPPSGAPSDRAAEGESKTGCGSACSTLGTP